MTTPSCSKKDSKDFFDSSFPKNQAIGSLHLEFKRCGKSNCRCGHGMPHGPYVYRRWREAGRQRRQHIAMHELAETLLALETARAHRDSIAALKKEIRDVG